MKVIFGIGNPGTRYRNTRHNVGFLILEKFADKHKLNFIPSKDEYMFCEGELDGMPFLLVKPVTYVNLSGVAADNLLNKINSLRIEDILVIVDDINLSTGDIRIRQSGGDGGHNGLSSIIYHLQSTGFPRIRFGIGDERENSNLADYVLSKFNSKTIDNLEDNFQFTVSLIENFITGGLKSSLNFYSRYYNRLNDQSEP